VVKLTILEVEFLFFVAVNLVTCLTRVKWGRMVVYKCLCSFCRYIKPGYGTWIQEKCLRNKP